MEFDINNQSYRSNRLDAFAQLHVSRKLAPILPKLMPVLSKLSSAKALTDNLEQMAELMTPLAEAFAIMPKDDVDMIITSCMSVVHRKQNTAWSPVMRNGVVMFDDIDLSTMLPMVVNVIRDSLGNFISGLLSSQNMNSPENTPT